MEELPPTVNEGWRSGADGQSGGFFNHRYMLVEPQAERGRSRSFSSPLPACNNHPTVRTVCALPRCPVVDANYTGASVLSTPKPHPSTSCPNVHATPASECDATGVAASLRPASVEKMGR